MKPSCVHYTLDELILISDVSNELSSLLYDYHDSFLHYVFMKINNKIMSYYNTNYNIIMQIIFWAIKMIIM